MDLNNSYGIFLKTKEYFTKLFSELLKTENKISFTNHECPNADYLLLILTDGNPEASYHLLMGLPFGRIQWVHPWPHKNIDYITENYKKPYFNILVKKIIKLAMYRISGFKDVFGSKRFGFTTEESYDETILNDKCDVLGTLEMEVSVYEFVTKSTIDIVGLHNMISSVLSTENNLPNQLNLVVKNIESKIILLFLIQVYTNFIRYSRLFI
jgi:hypothetical protein